MNKAKQKGGRIGGRSRSPAKAAASRANLAKANAVLWERGLTPEHLEKLRQGLIKARACRLPSRVLRQARKMVQHGLFSRHLRDTTVSLGENPRDFDSLLRRVRRYLAPQNEAEEKLANLIGQGIWRHHRLFFAQARWEIHRLLFFFGAAPPLRDSDPEMLVDRAYILYGVLAERSKFFRQDSILRGSVARLLRRFLRLRSGNPKLEFKTHTRSLHLDEDETDKLIWGSDFLSFI